MLAGPGELELAKRRAAWFEQNRRHSFSPLSISGLVGWWDFSDITTLFTDTARTAQVVNTGDTIAGVTDKSGTGNHLAQAIAGQRPAYTTGAINGKSVSRATAARNDFLAIATFTLAQPFTLVAVVKNRTALGGGTFTGIWAGAGGSSPQMTFQGTSTVYRAYFGGSTQATTATWDTTNPHIVTTVANAASSNIRIDSVNQTLNPGTDGFAAEQFQVSMGSAANTTPGDIDTCEVLLYNSALSAGNLTSVDVYLKPKWGTP
jgi:hypothetical protein